MNSTHTSTQFKKVIECGELLKKKLQCQDKKKKKQDTITSLLGYAHTCPLGSFLILH